ncbi:MAG: IS1634 family transposase [Gemmatimonadetes bacterium]|nr:MAG: IS1634 family transposase [Gemmatimonadota bacterium]
MLLLSAHEKGKLPTLTTRRIGAVRVFERLWRETGCREVIESLARERRFGFPVERAVFLTVLHRLLAPGSDRRAERWREDYAIEGTEGLGLHHLYRAMAWLGEPLAEQRGASPLGPRCTKDRVEEALFSRRRDLLSELELVFLDTTSLYFEGEGGQSLGRRGHSKDHRPDLKQMVVGAVLDGEGRPVACEMWPGNTTDVKVLLPVAERLAERFRVRRACLVADRGMISARTLGALEERGWPYILGARMRSQKEVCEQVLSRAGRYRVVREGSGKPAPLKVKEVWVEGRRYIVCLNEAQARKDAAEREEIVQALREQLRAGAKSLVGNRGYRRYLKSTGEAFEIDQAKLKAEARFDGKWVLRTNTELAPEEVALRYKQLWQVEALFRSTKSLLQTRPIFHRCDETIRGHVFCSFLALVLRKALLDRLEAAGASHEWADVLRDLEALQEIDVLYEGKRFRLRTEARGACAPVFRAVGLALPPTVQRLPEVLQAS